MASKSLKSVTKNHSLFFYSFIANFVYEQEEEKSHDANDLVQHNKP